MTSSNEPQLTRRELRELERLREQQAGAATPEQAAPPAAAPVYAAPPAQAPAVPQYAPQPVAPQPVAAPVLPAQPPAQAPQQQVPAPYPAPGQGFAPPRPAGGFDQAAPLTAVPPQNPFAPRPSAQPAAEAPPQPAVPAAAQAQSAPASAPSMPSAPERTLTRRELRAMLDGAQLDDFDDEFDDEPVASTAVASATPVVHGVQPPPQQQQPQAAQQQRLPQAMPASLATPQPAVNPIVDASVANLPGVSAGSPGHWTSQLNLPEAEERAEPFDQMLSRGALSHGVPTTTNALILPSLPDQGAFANQLSQPGEVLATGSIDLPRSYGATGVHPSQVDSSDVDRLFEHQVEDVGTGVAPVAATRAISTQGAARTMISPPKKEGMNVPLVLAVTAGVLALGVVGTLVIGAMTGLF
ncbi:hypothetical protein [Agromyces lapidis]|uniref:Uncharacterized protein n=1 Tax=Agromyces lapidis TaxID=279574 RepID=A0ABV5SQB8_9MICO|nr:hypothetical protein [Agromyces lapidis]